MPVMRYVPQFIEKQYVPLNDLGLIDKALAQRQKLHDTSKMLENQTLSELYGLSTTQGFEPERNRIIEDLQAKIQEATARRGGDPSAATQDIMSIIATAQKNPFFQRNREVMEQTQLLEKMRASNPSLRILRDPRTLEYKPDLTAEDLQYQVLDPTQITKITEDMFGDLRKKRGELQAVRHPVFGTVARQQIGATDEEIAGLSTPETVNQVLSQAGYSDLAETNPELYNEMAGIVYNQLKSLNQGYDDTPWSPPYRGRGNDGEQSNYTRDLLVGMGYDLQPKGLDELSILNPDKLNEEIVKEAQKLGIPDVNNLADLRRIAQPTVSQMTAEESVGRLGASPPIKFTRENPHQRKAYELLQSLNEKVTTDPSYALPRFSLNSISSSSPEEINKIKTVIGAFNQKVSSLTGRNEFIPATNDDIRAYNSIKEKGKLEVVDIIPTMKSTRNSMILNVAGEDDKGNPIYFKMKLPRPAKYRLGMPDPLADSYYGFLTGLSPSFNIQYNLINHPEQLVRMGFTPEEISIARQEIGLPNPFSK